MAGAIIPAVLGSAASAAIGAALQPGGGATTVSVAKEPEAVHRARGEAIRTVSPILLDLIRSPEYALARYTGLTRLVAPLTPVERMALDIAGNLFERGLKTPLDELALERALAITRMRPSDLLAPEVSALVGEYLYGPEAEMLQYAREVAQRAVEPTSPVERRQVGRRISDLIQEISDLESMRRYLAAKQMAADAIAWLNAARVLDRLQAKAADVAREMGGMAGILGRMATAGPIAAFPRLREVQERGAAEDVRKRGIEAALGLMRISPAGRVTEQRRYGPTFLESFLPRFAAGVGSALYGMFSRPSPSPSWSTSVYSPDYFSLTGSSGSVFSPDYFSLTGTPSPQGQFSLSPNLPSWLK